MSLGAKWGDKRKTTRLSFSLRLPSSPPTPHPNPLCRPAGKGRPAAKARAAGKMWWLPSRSGGSGGGVTHSFVLPEASILTVWPPGPLPNCSSAHPFFYLLVHSWRQLLVSQKLSQPVTHAYTHFRSLSLWHSLLELIQLGPMPRASCQTFASCHGSREKGAEHQSEPTIMTHSWSQMCHICSHDGDFVYMQKWKVVIASFGKGWRSSGGTGIRLQPVFPNRPDCWAEVESQASRREMIGISLEERNVFKTSERKLKKQTEGGGLFLGIGLVTDLTWWWRWQSWAIQQLGASPAPLVRKLFPDRRRFKRQEMKPDKDCKDFF